MRRIIPTDQSKLYDQLRAIFRNQPNAYSPISPVQSQQEYITIPSPAEGYIDEIYEDQAPGFGDFTVEQEYEPYEPQFVEFVKTLIQKAPMIQSVLEQNPEFGYNPEAARLLFDLLLEVSRSRGLEYDVAGNMAQDDDSGMGEPDIDSLAQTIMPESVPEQMPEMPEMMDIDPMDGQEQQMDLEMMLYGRMPDEMPDQMPDMAEMEQMQEQEPEPEPEQQMTLEMLINSLFFPGG